jgi:hypothetical protein
LEAGASGCATETTDKAAQASTPDSDSLEFQEEDLKEQVSSPKKKRAHAEVDPGREVEEADARSVASSDSAKHRGQRSEPEKKRHRDEVTESVQSTDESVWLIFTLALSLSPFTDELNAPFRFPPFPWARITNWLSVRLKLRPKKATSLQRM